MYRLSGICHVAYLDIELGTNRKVIGNRALFFTVKCEECVGSGLYNIVESKRSYRAFSKVSGSFVYIKLVKRTFSYAGSVRCDLDCTKSVLEFGYLCFESDICLVYEPFKLLKNVDVLVFFINAELELKFL